MSNGRHGGSRMAKEWSFMPAFAGAMTDNSTLIGSNIAFALPGTVIRMLGEYVIGATAVVPALDQAVVSVGIGVFSTDAVTLGATAMPEVAAEAEYPWLYWASHPLYWGTVDTGATAIIGNVRHKFDVRSMRKLKPRESLSMVIEYTDIVGTPALMILAGSTRVLIALG